MKAQIKIAIVGAASSGKTLLAHGIVEELKLRHLPAVFVGEAATKFILTCGVPKDIADQHTIARWQMEEEEHVPEDSIVVCDCAVCLTYIYAPRTVRRDIPEVEQKRQDFYLNILYRLHRESVKTYDFIFFVPLEHGYLQDKVRWQRDENEAQNISREIKGFLESERVPFFEISGTQTERRRKILEIISPEILKGARKNSL